MLLVIPISFVDLDLAVSLARRIVALGQMEEQRVIVTTSWSDSWDVEQLLEILRPAFAETRLYVYSDPELNTWPEAPGHAFYQFALYLEEQGNTESWMYLEPDCVLMRAGWFQEAKAEYEKEGKPFWGAVNESRFRNVRTNAVIVRGHHLVGGAGTIYPFDLLSRAPTLHTLVPNTAYDVVIGPWIVPSAFATSLVAHRFRTCNYRRENGVIVCDNFEPKPRQHLYAAPIPPETIITHGDKSGSLDKLLSQSESPL